MKYIYYADNLCFINDEDTCIQLVDDQLDKAVNIIADALRTLADPTDEITYLGPAKVTIELLTTQDVKHEFTTIDFGKWGKPIPVGVKFEED